VAGGLGPGVSYRDVGKRRGRKAKTLFSKRPGILFALGVKEGVLRAETSPLRRRYHNAGRARPTKIEANRK